MIPTQKGKALSEDEAREVISAVIDQYAITQSQFYERSNNPRILRCRRICAWLLTYFGLSRREVAKLLERDHTAISQALQRIALFPEEITEAESLLDQWSLHDPKELRTSLYDVFANTYATPLWSYLSDTLLGWERHQAATCAAGCLLLARHRWMQRTIKDLLRTHKLSRALPRLDLHVEQMLVRR